MLLVLSRPMAFCVLSGLYRRRGCHRTRSRRCSGYQMVSSFASCIMIIVRKRLMWVSTDWCEKPQDALTGFRKCERIKHIICNAKKILQKFLVPAPPFAIPKANTVQLNMEQMQSGLEVSRAIGLQPKSWGIFMEEEWVLSAELLSVLEALAKV